MEEFDNNWNWHCLKYTCNITDCTNNHYEDLIKIIDHPFER